MTQTNQATPFLMTRNSPRGESMETRLKILLNWVYLVNASVLITHEIDSGYWHEWELFGIPGGIQFFLFLNLILVVVLFYGFWAFLVGRSSGYIFSWLLAGSGLFAFTIHGYFLVNGDRAFRLPLSISLLFATLVLSVLQVYLLFRLKTAVTN